MISSKEGLEILRNWKRKRTSLFFIPFEFADGTSLLDAKVVEVDASALKLEIPVCDPRFVFLDLRKAKFNKATGANEVPDDVPLPVWFLERYSFFLFIRLEDGRPILLAEPVLIN
jgi:hypothetical protein